MPTAIIFFVIVKIAIMMLVDSSFDAICNYCGSLYDLANLRHGNFKMTKNPAQKKPGSNKFTLIKSISEQYCLFYQQFLPHRDRLQFFYQQLPYG